MSTLLGRTTTDVACLVTSDLRRVCSWKGFTFFEVTNIQGYTLNANYSGILGIAPDDPSNGPSFVATLNNDGYIHSKMISLLLKRSPLSSFATFGGYSQFMMYTLADGS